jgi:hypothetical protein
MPQTAISRLESPNYGKPTITTLKRMARVYDVGLDVRFVPFSLLIDRMSKTPRMDMGLTSDSVDVPSFEEEEEQCVFGSVVSAGPISVRQVEVRNVCAAPARSWNALVFKGYVDTSGYVLGYDPEHATANCGYIGGWNPVVTETLVDKTTESMTKTWMIPAIQELERGSEDNGRISN